MKKYQISKNKSTFDRVSPKLVVAFGFVAIILTMLWIIVSLIKQCTEDPLAQSFYKFGSIQVIALLFYASVSGLMIARASINMKSKESSYSIVFNMACGIAILIYSAVYMFIFYFCRTYTEFFAGILSEIMKYSMIALICIVWGMCFSFVQIKNGAKQDVHAIKGSNAASVLVTGCLMIPAYSLVFAFPLISGPKGDLLNCAKAITNTMFFLLAIIVCAQLIMTCLNKTENKKKEIILLSVCVSLIFISYVLVKSFSGILLKTDFAYVNMLCGLATTCLTIPVYIKTRN